MLLLKEGKRGRESQITKNALIFNPHAMSYAVGHSKLSIMREFLFELDVTVSSFTNHDMLGVMQASLMCLRAPPHDNSVVVHEGSHCAGALSPC